MASQADRADLEEAEDWTQLRRSKGTLALTAFAVAAIIGSGIFVLSGVAASEKAGPAIMLSFVSAGTVSCLYRWSRSRPPSRVSRSSRSCRP